MIKFIPKIVPIKSVLSDKEGFINNAKNKSLSAQLENRFKNVLCPDHSDIQSSIFFDHNDNGVNMTVQSYCCDKFNETLVLIAAEKYPLPPKQD